MILNRLAWAAVLVCIPWAALTEPATTDEPLSMRFEWVREGPADVCGDKCRHWVTASGPITKSTVQDFKFFSQVRDLKGATLVLDSGGGSVLASLELGRKVRALGMDTTVGRVVKQNTAPGQDQRGKFTPRAECASMCVFVLLGGVKRTVPTEARVLVHQIWPGAKRYDASAETYTAEELVRIQRDVGRIARYTVEMGGGIELFETAMRIPPWERLRALNRSELRRMGLQTIEVADVPTSGAVSPNIRARSVSSVGTERGWVLSDADPTRELFRRHPLTIEGEEIGQFELSLTCADEGEYRLAYQETRNVRPDEDMRLQDVVVRLGGERTVLSIAASSARESDGELDSRAVGRIKGNFLDALSKDATSVLTVFTRTSDNLSTSIRVGGTGFAKAFARLAANCTRPVSQ